MTISRRVVAGLLVALFVLAVVTRAHHPVSHSKSWLPRSIDFVAALRVGEWMGTLKKGHPGVTTMAIGGSTMSLYHAVAEKPAAALFDWVLPPYANDEATDMAVGVYGLSIAVAASIVAIALALRRLSGDWWLALTGAGLLTLEPFHLAQSRILHPDGLLSTLMLLSTLLLLISLQEGQRRHLMLSGLVAGLAVLTKTPALFLVPFTGLALLVHLAARLRVDWPDHVEGRGRWVLGQVWHQVAAPFLLWALLLVLPFALWPAMWAQPGAVLREMFAESQRQIVRPHDEPIVLAGKLFYEGRATWFYYPVTLVFNVSFVTATLALLGLGYYTWWRGRVSPPLKPPVYWLLVAYIFFFDLQMSFASRYSIGGRYILPVYPILNVLAAVGMVGFAGVAARALRARRERLARALPAALAGLVVGLQALVALPYAPYYSTHANNLLGGNRVAHRVFVNDWTEGIFYVADYLHDQPHPETLTVATANGQTRKTLEQFFPGRVYKYEDRDFEKHGADYFLFDVSSLQQFYEIERLSGWEPAAIWEAYRDEPAQLVVEFDGVEYLWLYAVHLDDGARQQTIVHVDGVWLVGLAWVWTLGLLGATLWALRRQQGAPGRTD